MNKKRTALARLKRRKIVQQEVGDEKEHRDDLKAKLLASRANVLQNEDRERVKVEN